MKVLIIEDEEFAAIKLVNLLKECEPGAIVLDQLDSVGESIKWFENNPTPDLVFMDIHLSDGLSFEIFEQVEVSAPIIFTTAYDQYAIAAFKTKSVDYLLKPIKRKDLRSSIDKYHELFSSRPKESVDTTIRELADMIRNQKSLYKSRFLIRAGKLIKSIAITDISYFVFEDRMTLLVTREGRRYPIKYTLDELEGQLDPLVFTRANRQFIVGFESIDQIIPWFKGRLKLILSPPQNIELVISSDKSRAFKEWLDR